MYDELKLRVVQQMDREDFIEYIKSLKFEKIDAMKKFDKDKNQYKHFGSMIELHNASTGEIYEVLFRLNGTRFLLNRISHSGKHDLLEPDEFMFEIEQ